MTTRFSPIVLCAFLLTFRMPGSIPGAATSPHVAQSPSSSERVHSVLIDHPRKAGARIEIVWTQPAGAGPWPVIVLVHGHQEGARPGARVYVENGGLDRYTARGLLAAAVSQPGYGRSDGPPDFCGPFSQSAVLAAVAYARSLPAADPRRFALYGYSRGAIVAGMAATELPDLSALVLGAGIYDLRGTYPRLAEGIQMNIEHEAGLSDDAFRARSPIAHVARIKAPTLVLHGELDDRASADSAQAFARALEKAGTPVRFVMFPGAGHGITPRDELNAEIDRFLKQHLSGDRR